MLAPSLSSLSRIRKASGNIQQGNFEWQGKHLRGTRRKDTFFWVEVSDYMGGLGRRLQIGQRTRVALLRRTVSHLQIRSDTARAGIGAGLGYVLGGRNATTLP